VRERERKKDRGDIYYGKAFNSSLQKREKEEGAACPGEEERGYFTYMDGV
jgi:hypothetical protein